MKNLILLALFALSPVALATNNEGGCRGNCGGNDIPASNELKQGQDQDQGQAQGQLQGQEQGQLQGQSQSADNYNSIKNSNDNDNTNVNVAEGGKGGNGYGGEQSQGQVSVNDNANSSNNSSNQATSINFEATKQRTYGNTPNVVAPSIYASSVCLGGVSGGVAGLGFGLSLGGTKQDAGCVIRENARIIAGIDANLALTYMCMNPALDVGKVLGDLCHPRASDPVVIPEAPKVEVPVEVVLKENNG